MSLAPPTARAEFLLEQARRALAWARLASVTCATDWPAAARAEAEGAIAEIETLTGRVEIAAMGEALIEAKAIIHEARELGEKR